MAKQTVPDLKELFRQAAEIAEQVPEAMQSAAFNRAVDLLTGGSHVTTSPSITPVVSPASDGKRRKIIQPSSDLGAVADLLEQIDSTQHPGIRSTSTVLDRSLMILQIARSEHNVDGLVPSVIARILTEKFRVNTTDVAVRMALGKVTNLVNRVQKGNAFLYRIMGPGEEYLAQLGQAKSASPTARAAKRKVRASRGAKSPEAHEPKMELHGATPATTKAPLRKRASGLGPKAAVTGLVESGFFDAPKTGPAVQEHLKKKRGYDIGTDQLRLAMLRLVRDGRLEREEGAEGQYEYKRPQS